MIEPRLHNEWLVNVVGRPNAKMRIFGFYYAGGSSNIFRGWENGLPRDVQFVPVELPGHGYRIGESLLDTLPSIVKEATTGISTFLEKPFVFFGHSMGALISFELARLFRRHFLPEPIHIFVSAHVAPHLSKERDIIHQLPRDEFIEKLRTLNGTPEAVLNNPELCDLFLPIIRNDFQVCETYVFQKGLPLECPITIYGGKNDKDISEQDLMAWGEHTTGGTRLKMFDGDHFFLHSHQKDVLETFARDLDHLLLRLEPND